MSMTNIPKRQRYPVEIIGFAVWSYHRFNDSYRDVGEKLAYRGIEVSDESIRKWCQKFGRHFSDFIKKRPYKPSDKWHLDEMVIKLNGESFILWRAVDSDGFELDVFLQKRKNKKAAIQFSSRLLSSYPAPKVVVTDKLPSYVKPIRKMMPQSEHRRHKGLNNRVENAHQATRRKEKCLIKFKSPQGMQQVIHLMGKIRNIFSVPVGRYKNSAQEQRCQLNQAFNIWRDTERLLCA